MMVLNTALISKAIKEIKQKQKSVTSVARQFGIPIATLHFYVTKRRKEDLKYARDTSHLKLVKRVDSALISKALEEIRLNKRSIASVARQFGIYKRTLLKYVIKRKKEDSSYAADTSHLQSVSLIDPALISKALEEVRLKQKSITSVARQFGLSKSTLHRHVNDRKKKDLNYAADISSKCIQGMNSSLTSKVLDELKLKENSIASVAHQFGINRKVLNKYVIKRKKEDLNFAAEISHIKPTKYVKNVSSSLVFKALEELKSKHKNINSVASKFGIPKASLNSYAIKRKNKDLNYAAAISHIKLTKSRILNAERVREALEFIKQKQVTVSSVAHQFGINKSTLSRHIKKRKQEDPNFAPNISMIKGGSKKKLSTEVISKALEEIRLKHKSIASVASELGVHIKTIRKYVSERKKEDINYAADLSQIKRKKNKYPPLISKALEEIRLSQRSIASVAREFGITRRLLNYYVTKRKENDLNYAADVSHTNPTKIVKSLLNSALLSKAIEEVKLTQNSISKVACKYNISETALRRHYAKSNKENLNDAAEESHIKQQSVLDPILISKALEELRLTQRSIASVAREFGITRRTLSNYVRRLKKEDSSFAADIQRRKKSSSIFDDNLEQKLISYILNSLRSSANIQESNVYLYDICKLAYKFAVFYKLEIPKGWILKKSAGRCWYHEFIKRHPTLVIKVLKIINLYQTERCNRDSIELLFDAFEQLVLKYKLNLNNIYYVNSIAVLNKHTFADDKKKIDGSKIIFLTISAAAKVLPHFSSIVQKGCSNQDLTEKDTFLEYLEHLIKHGKFSRKNPCLLLMAYNNYGMTLESAKVAANNGINMLEFPEDYPQELKPLNLIHNSLLKTLDGKTTDSALLNLNTEMESVFKHENIKKVCKILINFSDERTIKEKL